MNLEDVAHKAGAVLIWPCWVVLYKNKQRKRNIQQSWYSRSITYWSKEIPELPWHRRSSSEIKIMQPESITYWNMIQPTNGAVTKRIFVIALQNLNFDKICGSLERKVRVFFDSHKNHWYWCYLQSFVVHSLTFNTYAQSSDKWRRRVYSPLTLQFCAKGEIFIPAESLIFHKVCIQYF